MDQGLVTVIGMSIAYLASFFGMALAWYGWKKRHQEDEGAIMTPLGALMPSSSVPSAHQ